MSDATYVSLGASFVEYNQRLTGLPVVLAYAPWCSHMLHRARRAHGIGRKGVGKNAGPSTNASDDRATVREPVRAQHQAVADRLQLRYAPRHAAILKIHKLQIVVRCEPSVRLDHRCLWDKLVW